MVEVSNCCFFIPLKIGAYIIGAIDVCFGIFLTLGTLNIINNTFGGATVALIIELVANILLVIAGLLLILGAYNGNKTLLKIWLILNIVLIIILALNCIYILIQTKNFVFTSGIIFAIISIYFIIVVWSLYQGGGGGGD